jgi:hypothetical protein
MTPEQIGILVLQYVGWSLGGIFALFVARIAYNLMTPFDPRKELCDDRNAAVGASHGMFIIAAAIILHGLIVGEKVAKSWWEDLLLMSGMYLVGLAMLWLGRVALRALVHFDLDEEIHVKDNLAVGLVEGASYLGFAIIVHAAL